MSVEALTGLFLRRPGKYASFAAGETGGGEAVQQSKMAIMPAWPSMLFFTEWPDHAERAPAIIAHIRELATTFEQPIASGIATSAKSAEGLVESRMDLFEASTEPNLKSLVSWFASCVRAAASKANGDAVPPERLRVDFCESWFHITNNRGFHDAHTHGNCSWCGIYYLAAGEPDSIEAGGATKAGNGINRFYSPLPSGGIARDYGNQYLGRNYLDVQPTDGRLVLFPAYLLHSALPYSGESDRIILSFNARVRRG